MTPEQFDDFSVFVVKAFKNVQEQIEEITKIISSLDTRLRYLEPWEEHIVVKNAKGELVLVYPEYPKEEIDDVEGD